MKKIQKEFKIQRLLQSIYFNSRTGNKEGYCKYYPNNTDEHENTKWEIFKKLKKQGYKVFTEVKFNNNKRADICAISKDSSGYIIEILCSETDKMFENKELNYPLEWELVKVYTKNFDINTWEL